MNSKYAYLITLILFSKLTFAKTPQKTDVLIIGAGLSGLNTAYELKKNNIKFHILELLPFAGGRIKTAKYHMPSGEILTADSGMEEYWESNPAVNLIKELGLKYRVDNANSSLILNGKVYEYSEKGAKKFLEQVFTSDELKEISSYKDEVSKILHELEKSPISKDILKLKDISFEDWTKKKVKSDKVANWIRISTECEAGNSWDNFSALDGAEEFSIMLGDGQAAYRVTGGNENLVNALVKKIGSKNISKNHRVTKVVSLKDKTIVSYLDLNTNTYKSIEAKYVVNTVPPFRFIMEVQLEPGLSAKKVEAIETQTYGSYFKAHIFVPASASKFWTKDGQSILPFLTDSETGVIYDGNPHQNTKIKIISLLITGSQAEAFNFQNQAEIREILKKRFDEFWPGFSKEIIDMEFHRYHPRAIGGWPVGRSRFDELSDELRKMENRLFMAGDYTHGTHSSDAIKSSQRVVSELKNLLK